MKVKNVCELVREELLSDTTDYELDMINDGSLGRTLVKLNQENVKKVECMLRYSPDYPQFFNFKNSPSDDECERIVQEIREKMRISSSADTVDENKITTKYDYSLIFYIFAFAIEIKEKKLDDMLYNCYIKTLLTKINFENHTRASHKEINEITCRICSRFSPNKLLESLEEPYEKEDYSECKYELIRCIIEKTSANKHHFSLGTKFCHFLNFYIYLETEYSNLFSIYDKIVSDNLPYYYNYYVTESNDDLRQVIGNGDYKYSSTKLKGLNDKQVCDKIIEIYQNYQTIIDEIISKTGISRNGFDHVVWYSGKSN